MKGGGNDGEGGGGGEGEGGEGAEVDAEVGKGGEVEGGEERKRILDDKVKDDPLLCRLAEEGGVFFGRRTDNDDMESLEGCPHIKLHSGAILPLPLCFGHGSKASGFHHLFEALKDRRCRLRSLHLSECLFKQRAEYLACLGQALASNSSLTRLQVDNILPDLPDIQFALPLLLPLRQNRQLTHLVLPSLGVTLQPPVVILMLQALAENSTLVHLDLSQWKFKVATGEEVLNAMAAWAKGTRVRELILQESEISLQEKSGCKFSSVSPLLLYFKMRKISFLNRSLEQLNISCLSVRVGDLQLRAGDFLGLLQLPSLCHLDISDPPAADQEEQPLPVDDQCLLSLFESLSNNCANTLQVLRMDNCGFRLSRPVETLARLKPLLKNLTGLATMSVNNMTCITCDPEEGGAAKVRDLLENHTPLLCSIIKHLPSLERLSMMRYQLCPDQLPRLVRAVKSQVVRRNGLLTLQAKHIRRCGAHPEHTDEDTLTGLIGRLERSKRVKCNYNGVTGALRVEAIKSQGILRRLSSMLATEGEE